MLRRNLKWWWWCRRRSDAFWGVCIRERVRTSEDDVHEVAAVDEAGALEDLFVLDLALVF